jgi:serine/threonine protein kinase
MALARRSSSVPVRIPRPGESDGRSKSSRNVPKRALSDSEVPTKGLSEYFLKRGYFIGSRIAKGGEGSLFSGKRVQDGRKIVVKLATTERTRYATLGVHRLLKKGESLQGVATVHDVWFIPYAGQHIVERIEVMEACEGIDLFEMLKRSTRSPERIVKGYTRPYISEDELRPIIRSLLGALASLHDHNIIHCDLKAENVMWDPHTKQVRIVDFGHSYACPPMSLVEVKNDHVGTKYTKAPEGTNFNYYSRASDIWGVGCIVFLCLFGYRPLEPYPPFSELRPPERFVPRVADGLGPHFPRAIPVSCDVRGFMSCCLQTLASRRPSAKALLLHRWLKEK